MDDNKLQPNQGKETTVL